VVLTIRERQSSLIETGDGVRRILGVLGRAFTDGGQSIALLQLAHRAFQIIDAVDRRNSIETRLERGGTQLLYCSGVHAGGVESTNLPFTGARLVLPRFYSQHRGVEN